MTDNARPDARTKRRHPWGAVIGHARPPGTASLNGPGCNALSVFELKGNAPIKLVLELFLKLYMNFCDCKV